MAIGNTRRCPTCRPDEYCQATQKPCPLYPDEHWLSFPPILNVHAWGVPNRLFGATINHEGDAV